MKFAESGQVGCLLQAPRLMAVFLAAFLSFFLLPGSSRLYSSERSRSEQVLFHIMFENHKLSRRKEEDF